MLGPRRRPGGVAVAPLVAYLVSPECTVTWEAYSAGWDWYGRVFVGVTGGWVAPDVDAVTVADIASRFEEIRDRGVYDVPRHNFDETRFIKERVEAAAGAPVR